MTRKCRTTQAAKKTSTMDNDADVGVSKSDSDANTQSFPVAEGQPDLCSSVSTHFDSPTISREQPGTLVEKPLYDNPKVNPVSIQPSRSTYVNDAAYPLNDINNHVKSELDLREQELLLEEEELRLRKKRVAFERIVRGGHSSRSVIPPQLDGGNQRVSVDSVAPMSTRDCNSTAKDSLEILESSLRSLIMGASLPKIEIDRFDGSPRDYHKFIHNFEGSISDRLHDDGQRLSYLFYYCVGRAKEAIEYCLLLPKSESFREALRILRQQFGRPHEIIRAMTE